MTIEIGNGTEHAVDELDRVELRVGDGDWPFVRENAAAIDAHWQQRRTANPAMFNGTIFMLGSGVLRERVLSGTLIKLEFKQFLYWKEHGYPDRRVRDVFGSALIRSAEGHIVLGRQAPGNVNAGLAYLPGGFIDGRDIDSAGHVRLEASVEREIAEETGLGREILAREPGLLLTRAGAMHSIAVPFRSPLGSAELRSRIEHHISTDPHSELTEVVIVRDARDLDGLAMPIYASVLLAHLLARQ